MTNLTMMWNLTNTYLQLPEFFYTKIAPKKVNNPSLVVMNTTLSKTLGLDIEALSDRALARFFSGSSITKDCQPLALAYAGHQFGHFAFLGDGRAHLLGELTTPQGRQVDVQLKGSGQTPYGMRGDGRAVLGPMLREYIISEAMHALGVPSTRSLAVVLTGEPVLRETFLPGAILCRVASSHLRIGTFQYAAAKNDLSGLKALADYTLTRHCAAEVSQSYNPYLTLLQLVIEKQVDLIVHWMGIGFIHGVMNTDNMAISGETIDYGPCAFMDFYDPATVFNSIDQKGRYCYANQPAIAQWNLARLAESLIPLLDKDTDKALRMAEEAVHDFKAQYENKWLRMMRGKLGIEGIHEQDGRLVSDLLNWMHQQQADFTNTFRDLMQEKLEGKPYDEPNFEAWYQRWQARLQHNKNPLKPSLLLMQANNPAVIPRNHKVNAVLEEALLGHYQPFQDLVEILRNPYQENTQMKPYQSPPKPSERIFKTFCGT